VTYVLVQTVFIRRHLLPLTTEARTAFAPKAIAFDVDAGAGADVGPSAGLEQEIRGGLLADHVPLPAELSGKRRIAYSIYDTDGRKHATRYGR
jgi:hypothetical protein